MHIPDGFLDAKTAVATGALAAAGLGMALRNARLNLPGRRVPLLGLSAAFVFAAQMLNFPLAGGTSGHLVGGVLAAALLGPSAAVIVVSAVLIVQCFLFADGGITALGGNIFNMALVGGVGGWAVYYLLSRAIKGLRGRMLAAVVAGWAGTVLASVACAGELAASHTVGWSVAFPAMAGVHALIGIGEGVITALVLGAIGRVRPDLLGLAPTEARGFEVVNAGSAAAGDAPPAHVTPQNGREQAGTLVVFGLLISMGLALFIAPFACGWPDGLEKTAEVFGFKEREQSRLVSAPAADYRVPGVASESVATGIAGAAGTIVVFGVVWTLATGLVRRNKPEGAAERAASSQ